MINVKKKVAYVTNKVLNTLIGRSKSSCLDVSLQVHSFSTNCVRELFKPSKDLASLEICNEKIFFGVGFQIFL